MDLKDATLMFAIESAGHPTVEQIAQSAYERLWQGELVSHVALTNLLGEASAKGVLRSLRRKHGPEAFQAIIIPICREIDRQRPVPPRSRPASEEQRVDPLTAPLGSW
jgi:hypothetical protein